MTTPSELALGPPAHLQLEKLQRDLSDAELAASEAADKVRRLSLTRQTSSPYVPGDLREEPDMNALQGVSAAFRTGLLQNNREFAAEKATQADFTVTATTGKILDLTKQLAKTQRKDPETVLGEVIDSRFRRNSLTKQLQRDSLDGK
jgi:hypothetical protein